MDRRFTAAAALAAALTLVTALTVLAQAPQPQSIEPLVATGPAFTYQGRLMRAGQPVSETCAVSVSLWDSLAGGAFLNSNTLNTVGISGGLFTVDLDYGQAAFTGEARYLEVAVKCAADANYVTLSPRTPLRAAPYALYSTGSWALGGNAGTNGTGYLGTSDNFPVSIGVNGTPAIRIYPQQQSPNIIGGYAGNNISSTLYGQTIAGGGSFFYENRTLREFGTVGGGRKNQSDGYGSTIAGGIDNWANNDYATVAGGLHNYATGNSSAIGGGFYNVAGGYVAYVGGGDLNLAMTQNATIGGGYSNTITGGQLIANNTIGGGVFNYNSGFAATIAGGHGNQALGEWSVLGGGGFNTASGRSSTVSGGEYNIASGAGSTVGGGGWNGGATVGNWANGPASTIGGGYANLTSADASYGVIGGGVANQITATAGANLALATIGGGSSNKVTLGGATVAGGNTNTASGFDATVGGGNGNTASGGASTVPGGAANRAQGYASFAAGQQAVADWDGCFVFNDTTNAPYNCAGANRFVVRATGGVEFATSSGTPTGVILYPSSGSWASFSDRNGKANFAAVDTHEVLAKVAAMPVTTWKYKSQDEEIRHIGPVAQDFYAAFGVGEDETHITTVDADGVALAAIQGLYEIVQEQDRHAADQLAEIGGLQQEVAALQAQNKALDARLSALERQSVARASTAEAPWELPSGAPLGLGLLGVVGMAGLAAARRNGERR